MIDLVWYDGYEIGVHFIDDDHRNLLNIMQDIRSAILKENYSKCAKLLYKLLDEARVHFKREEEFLAEAGYPGLAEHHKYHEELLIQADTTRKICEGTLKKHNLQECFDGMALFLIDDILGGDVKFKPFLKERGYMR